MPVYIKSLESIKKRLGINENGRVQAFMTNACRNHMDKYVPLKDNHLRSIVEVTPNTITYMSPYASYQYYGKRKDGSHVVKHYTTAGTGPYWDERMKSAEIDEVIKEVQNYVGGK